METFRNAEWHKLDNRNAKCDQVASSLGNPLAPWKSTKVARRGRADIGQFQVTFYAGMIKVFLFKSIATHRFIE
jgi:hypothetical protein